MAWDSIDGLRKTARFREAYGLLSSARRMQVDHALIKSSMGMHGFAKRRKPVLWDALTPNDASALDTAIGTQLALGVFRAVFVQTFTAEQNPMTEAVDEAAREVDVRAAQLLLDRFARKSAALENLNPSKQAAFHQALDNLSRLRGTSVLYLASIATDAALSVDMALEGFAEQTDKLDEQLDGIRFGAGDALQTHAKKNDVPPVEAGALWMLAMRGRGAIFGQEERTQAYSDYDDSSFL